MASTFKIIQEEMSQTISFSFRLIAYGLTLSPMMQPENVDLTINGDVVTVTISNVSDDYISKSLAINMYGNTPYYGNLDLILDSYPSSTDVNFHYWRNCVTSHSNTKVTASLQCIYDKDKADANYDDYCIFNIEVDGVKVNCQLTIEHQIL